MKLNFLPYPKGNRDEWISKSDLERISGPYMNTDTNRDTEKIKESIQALRSRIRIHLDLIHDKIVNLNKAYLNLNSNL